MGQVQRGDAQVFKQPWPVPMEQWVVAAQPECAGCWLWAPEASAF